MDELPQSEFNMAFSYLNRLNYSFWTLNEAKRRRDLSDWSNELLILTDELSTEASIVKNLETKTTELKNILNEVEAVQKKNTHQGKKAIPTTLYWKLISYERWLRQQMDAAGLLKKMKESAADALK